MPLPELKVLLELPPLLLLWVVLELWVLPEDELRVLPDEDVWLL